MPFKAAHGIVKSTGLGFEHAYTLARLVEGGGPVSCRGKNSFITKPAETALMRLGLIAVDASSEFTQRYYIDLNVGGPLGELLDAKFARPKLTAREATERARWSAVATQDAFDLVATSL
ncbi:hypothetical protein EAS64_38655 [Trebonia kvetii]|uniref:Uncharacterized protein n=1 Tax=Trebonia kvetii TaxID=2480626 RepID=A0A6P2BNA5_9ACTN|nr:hypothetical protein [Trebonia kvetii]TVZ00011.1 hypothetical protein EAS64_38655 [Trebonia kvetii]